MRPAKFLRFISFVASFIFHTDFFFFVLFYFVFARPDNEFPTWRENLEQLEIRNFSLIITFQLCSSRHFSISFIALKSAVRIKHAKKNYILFLKSGKCGVNPVSLTQRKSQFEEILNRFKTDAEC